MSPDGFFSWTFKFIAWPSLRFHGLWNKLGDDKSRSVEGVQFATMGLGGFQQGFCLSWHTFCWPINPHHTKYKVPTLTRRFSITKSHRSYRKPMHTISQLNRQQMTWIFGQSIKLCILSWWLRVYTYSVSETNTNHELSRWRIEATYSSHCSALIFVSIWLEMIPWTGLGVRESRQRLMVSVGVWWCTYAGCVAVEMMITASRNRKVINQNLNLTTWYHLI